MGLNHTRIPIPPPDYYLKNFIMSTPIVEYFRMRDLFLFSRGCSMTYAIEVYSFKPKHLLDDVTMGYAHVVCNESDEVL